MISHLVRFLAMFQDFTTGVEVANHHFFGGENFHGDFVFFFSWWHPRSAAWDFTKGGWSTELYRRLEVPLVHSSVLRGNFRNEELRGRRFQRGDDHDLRIPDGGPWTMAVLFRTFLRNQERKVIFWRDILEPLGNSWRKNLEKNLQLNSLWPIHLTKVRERNYTNMLENQRELPLGEHIHMSTKELFCSPCRACWTKSFCSCHVSKEQLV